MTREGVTRRALLGVAVGVTVGVEALAGADTATAQSSGPTASFTYSPSSPVPDEDVTLDGSGSDGSIQQYDWEVVDADGYTWSYSGQQITYAWETGGTFDVTLTVTDDAGDADSTTEAVTVTNAAPTASIAYSPERPVPDESVTLDGSGSTDSDGSITEYDWEVVDADGYTWSYSGEQISYAWETGGTFDVTLTVTDNGEKTDTVTTAIEVTNASPTADFTVSPASPTPDEDVTLDGSVSSDPDGTVTEYDWEVVDADGYTWSYSGEQTTVSWETGGTFDVTLTVTDNGEKTDTVTKTVEVGNTPPTADFTQSPPTVVPDEDVTFDATGSADSDGSIQQYDWEVVDADGYTWSYSGEQITYAWESEGTYDVRLTVTDNGEKTDTITKAVEVGNTPPTATISITPADPGKGDMLTFDASDSTDPEGNIDTYEWQIMEARPTGETVKQKFEVRGGFEATVTVTDTKGASDTTSTRFFVGNRAPDPTIEGPSEATVGATVTFDASDSTDPDGTIESYRWAFPDGTTATGSEADHAFAEAGERTVKLTVVDDGGRSETATRAVSVAPAATETATATEPPAQTDEEAGTAVGTDTRTETPTDETATETSAAGSDGGSGGSEALPVAVGLGALGVGGLLYRRYGGETTDTGPSAADHRAAGDEAAAAGDAARERGDYREAASEYEAAISAYESAKEAAEATGDEALAADVEGESAQTRQSLAAVRGTIDALDAIRDPLSAAESSLQTAVASHVLDSGVAARRDYRQARDQYDRALAAIEESDYDVFDEEGGVTVSVIVTTDHIPEKLAGWATLSEEEVATLSEAGIGTLTDLVDVGESGIRDLRESGAIDESLAGRLRAARWWHGADERTFTSQSAIERQRERASEGHRMLD